MSVSNDSRIALRFSDFRLFLIQRFLAVCSHMMLTVAVGQFVYEMTKSAYHLGYVGLALFVPKFGFSLFTGHAADRYDKQRVILICRFVQLAVVLGLFAFSVTPHRPMAVLYILLLLMGTANAFEGPATQSFVTHLIPKEHFANAVTWISTFFQIGLIAGPALGGWLYAVAGQASIVFLNIAILRLLATILTYRMKTRTGRMDDSKMSMKTLVAGMHYVWKKKILLGTISLDLFAVLLGGATALMPIFANEILHVGASGLGALRAAPGIGAAATSFLLAHLPPIEKAGKKMLACVTTYGICTILFGWSHHFYWSLVILFVMGAADMISVVIRHTLVQLQTPPSMRGRVSAVNLIFIGASNELGEFESGLTAGWFGTVPAVIFGGLGTLMVAGLWTWLFPDVRNFDKLNQEIEGGLDA